MRIKLTLDSIGKQTIDLNYNYALSSMIYNLIRESDSKYSTFLHEKGYEINNKHYKLFTFSQLKPEKYEINGSCMSIQGKVVLYITSPMKEFILSLVKTVTGYPEIRIDKVMFRVINIEVMAEPKFSRCMKFMCLSPITISTAFLKENARLKRQDLFIEDRRFTENLRANIISKYEILHGKKPEDTEFEVKFTDVDKYKKGKLIDYKGIKIKGYLAPFEVCGNPELIATAYECGVGDRNSLGMGMIEVVRDVG
ncbi:CRISPR-associated endoribonuclease Cas6 [Clostridium thermosuccinogenes]|uniref:CRISPR-associated endoribonuclease Cas6 n=1 Tax=Clostridium thermosuccinogenes TaxID=84032 RepID=UPI000CCBE2B2|nr:CRISPR-associated endoribonuclease Cas6 [Pseudoclostridium thermosuccinogenes]PNT91006.1 CRISPR-associated endoribonuclease Cas6 [Pseudoclostridium thermosuccinogenes]